MTHCSDDDLVLHYYGEDDRPASHLAECPACSTRYDALRTSLQVLTAIDVPDRPQHYGLEVWQRIRHRLPERAPWWRGLLTWPAAAAAATAMVLIAVGFTAGRIWPQPAAAPGPAAARTAAASDDARRVLLLTVADHLDQTNRALTDIVNAPAGDISAEQAWAIDLVAASRLYRQEATETNETSLVAVLDELERTLLDVVHRPSRATRADIEEIRRRVDSAALLFKVRVMSTELRELTERPVPPSSSSTQSIG